MLSVPDRYAGALFKIPRKWIKPLFIFSEMSVVLGIIMLAYDLTMPVIITLVIWFIVCIVYYPIRRSFMRKRGVDLDVTTSDVLVFQENVLETLKK